MSDHWKALADLLGTPPLDRGNVESSQAPETTKSLEAAKSSEKGFESGHKSGRSESRESKSAFAPATPKITEPKVTEPKVTEPKTTEAKSTEAKSTEIEDSSGRETSSLPVAMNQPKAIETQKTMEEKSSVTPAVPKRSAGWDALARLFGLSAPPPDADVPLPDSPKETESRVAASKPVVPAVPDKPVALPSAQSTADELDLAQLGWPAPKQVRGEAGRERSSGAESGREPKGREPGFKELSSRDKASHSESGARESGGRESGGRERGGRDRGGRERGGREGGSREGQERGVRAEREVASAGESVGRERVRESAPRENESRESSRSERGGRERSGPERTGSERTGSERTVRDRGGRDSGSRDRNEGTRESGGREITARDAASKESGSSERADRGERRDGRDSRGGRPRGGRHQDRRDSVERSGGESRRDEVPSYEEPFVEVDAEDEVDLSFGPPKNRGEKTRPAAAGWDVEAEADVEDQESEGEMPERRGRRRRNRRRGGAGRSESGRSESVESRPAGRSEERDSRAGRDGAKRPVDDVDLEYEADVVDDVAAEGGEIGAGPSGSERRSRRRRRRGGRRSEVGKGPAAELDQEELDLSEGYNLPSLLADEIEASEDDDSRHTKIPTWEETLKILVTTNIEARHRPDQRGGGQRQGGGHGGRGRGGNRSQGKR